MKDLLLFVVALIATFSVALNFVLVNKVNELRQYRKADREMAQTLVASAVKAACEIQRELDIKEEEIKVLNDKIDIAIDVIEKLEDKVLSYRDDIEAASHIHNKLYELLTQKKIVKRIWNKDLVEFYDINSMSLEEIHDLFGHPITA